MKENKYYKEVQQRYQELKKTKSYLDCSGIYCIKLKGQIIYIGKATNLLCRILSHQVNTELGLPEHKYDIFRGIISKGYQLQFEVLAYVDQENLGVEEGKWIRKYVPILNYQIPKEDGIHYTVNPIAKQATAQMVIDYIGQDKAKPLFIF